MVVRSITMEPSETSKTTSSNLTFGMDRILSTQKTSTRLATSESSNCTLSSACSGCVFNTLRCCTSANPRVSLPYYRQTLHAPQPLRPYTNVLVQSESSTEPVSNNTHQKRKRSWSRAVFSNLQRKGLEKRFQLQKYITKPDRRQLAATLGLTDAQVKVWFQNRRMKWRHTKEGGREDLNCQRRNGTSLTFIDPSQRQCNDSDESDSDVDVQTVDSEYSPDPS